MFGKRTFGAMQKNNAFIIFFGVMSGVALVQPLKFVEEELQKPHLQVRTENGYVQGVRIESAARGSYYAYLGIPYAKPPIGSLRFRAPQLPEDWTGILDGSRQGSNCVEFHPRLTRSIFIDGNEDCLFVNVFTKTNPRRTKKLHSVMVFIYGGAFLEGSADISVYGPDFLLSKEVIVVTFNYRLGLFGFLNTEDLASPGNYGLKDQNFALRWVQRNIRNFGGNPKSVTIFGQSAGSVSVNFHLLSPKSRGLFHRAIMESGSVLCHWGSVKKPRNVAYLLGVANGITNPRDSEDLVESLRRIDIEQLLYSSIGSFLLSFTTATLLGIPYAPSIEPHHEDAFMSQDYWYEMLKSGDFNKVPVMIGMNSNESLFFANVIRAIRPFFGLYDIDPSFFAPPAMNITDYWKRFDVGKIVSDYYFDSQPISGSSVETIAKFTDADYFSRPIHKTAELMGKHTPTYFYVFSHEGDLGVNGIDIEGRNPEFKGVRHAEELYYILNRLGNKSKCQVDNLVRERMLSLWTNFAKFGDPTPSRSQLLNSVVWPTVQPVRESNSFRYEYLEINDTLTVKDEFGDQVELNWWEDMFAKYGEPPLRTY